MLMIPNNGETALHGCYYLSDKALRMRYVLAKLCWFTSLAFKFVFLKKCHHVSRAFLCSILEYSRKTLHESNSLLVLLAAEILHWNFIAVRLHHASSGFSSPDKYSTKEEKPLQVTICFSIEHARPRVACVITSNDITYSFSQETLVTLRSNDAMATRKPIKQTNKTKNNRFNIDSYIHILFARPHGGFRVNVTILKHIWLWLVFSDFGFVKREQVPGGTTYRQAWSLCSI